MAKYTVWCRATLEFELPVEAASYNDAVMLATKRETQLKRIVQIIKDKRAGFNDFNMVAYGVFKDDSN